MDDPERWSVHRQSGLRFRRATRMELAENGWFPGTFLVETGRLLRDARRAARRLDVLVPLSDSTAQTVRFDLLSSQAGPLAIETRAIPAPGGSLVQVTTSTPTFHYYHSEVRNTRTGTDIGGALMLLLSSNLGGLSAHGVVQGVDVQVSGPSSTWTLQDIAAAGKPVQPATLAKVALFAFPQGLGGAWGDCGVASVCDLICGYLGGGYPSAEGTMDDDHPCLKPFDEGDPPTSQCDDGLDNDGDGTKDDLDLDCEGHPHDPGTPFHYHKFESGRDFGLFGEGQACTDWDTNWVTEVHAISTAIINGFRKETGPLDQPLRWQVYSCWIFPTQAAASECDNTGSCPDFDEGAHIYPYAGDDGVVDAYREDAPSDLQHAKVLGLDLPVPIAHVLHKGTLIDEENPNLPSCGEAPPNPDDAFAGYTASGVLVDNCYDNKSATHEIGHSFGAAHELYPNDGPPYTFMKQGDASGEGWLYFFSPLNAAAVNTCFTDYTCPNVQSFGY